MLSFGWTALHRPWSLVRWGWKWTGENHKCRWLELRNRNLIPSHLELQLLSLEENGQTVTTKMPWAETSYMHTLSLYLKHFWEWEIISNVWRNFPTEIRSRCPEEYSGSHWQGCKYNSYFSIFRFVLCPPSLLLQLLRDIVQLFILFK